MTGMVVGMVVSSKRAIMTGIVVSSKHRNKDESARSKTNKTTVTHP
ncbi:hypothetical protein ACOJR9_16300 [Alteromonas sp. A081]